MIRTVGALVRKDVRAELRTFEATYRANLTEHLRQQIGTLESGHAQPSPVPDLASPAASGASSGGAHVDGSGSDSETPRLDALLGDQH